MQLGHSETCRSRIFRQFVISPPLMPTFQIYNVIPTLPAVLEPLREMTFNLWWTWEPSARGLFRHLDPDLGTGLIIIRCACFSSHDRRDWKNSLRTKVF